ncbi:MAG: hypothetical protein RLZZ24_962 [Pseudomonadota bacterium]|jgi:hypothetical protein
MYIPDVINTLLMGLIFIVIVVTVVRPIMLNLVHTQVDGDDIQKLVNNEVNKHLIRHFQDQAAQRSAEIRFQKLLLDVPKKPERETVYEEEEEDEVPAVVAAPVEAPVAEPEPVAEEVVAENESTQESEADVSSEEVAQSDASDDATESEEEDMAEGDIEIREGESLAEIKERLKREQKQAKKPAIPPELLNNANSYEDKVGVVRMVVQADHSRVASLVRSMIQGELQKGVK